MHNSLSAVPNTGAATTLPRLPCTASLYCLPGQASASVWGYREDMEEATEKAMYGPMKAGWLSAFLLPLPCSSLQARAVGLCVIQV